MDFLYSFKEWLTVVVSVVTVLASVGTLLFNRRAILKARDTAREAEILIASSDLEATDHPKLTEYRQLSGRAPKDPADRPYQLLQEYHSQGLAQSRVSFWFSLIFASIGFVVIMIGLLNVQSQKQISQQSSSFISLIAGTVIDAVSALFFVQSNKARQLMSEFFDKLRVDRKLDESLRISDSITDALLKARTKAALAFHLSGLNPTEQLLSQLLSPPSKTQ